MSSARAVFALRRPLAVNRANPGTNPASAGTNPASGSTAQVRV
jgi:hypothetical protein